MFSNNLCSLSFRLCTLIFAFLFTASAVSSAFLFLIITFTIFLNALRFITFACKNLLWALVLYFSLVIFSVLIFLSVCILILFSLLADLCLSLFIMINIIMAVHQIAIGAHLWDIKARAITFKALVARASTAIRYISVKIFILMINLDLMIWVILILTLLMQLKSRIYKTALIIWILLINQCFLRQLWSSTRIEGVLMNLVNFHKAW